MVSIVSKFGDLIAEDSVFRVQQESCFYVYLNGFYWYLNAGTHNQEKFA